MSAHFRILGLGCFCVVLAGAARAEMARTADMLTEQAQANVTVLQQATQLIRAHITMKHMEVAAQDPRKRLLELFDNMAALKTTLPPGFTAYIGYDQKYPGTAAPRHPDTPAMPIKPVQPYAPGAALTAEEYTKAAEYAKAVEYAKANEALDKLRRLRWEADAILEDSGRKNMDTLFPLQNLLNDLRQYKDARDRAQKFELTSEVKALVERANRICDNIHRDIEEDDLDIIAHLEHRDRTSKQTLEKEAADKLKAKMAVAPVFHLKNGEQVTAFSAIDGGDFWTVKSPDGKIQTINKADIEGIEKP